MSELIQTHDNRATIRWKLLTGASALALSAYISSTMLARAEDADRPTLWIELGGQMEQVAGTTGTFTAPFMSLTPTPDVYNGISFVGNQKSPRFSFGGEGKISFQPEDSDWVFSAGVRYGRSHANRHVHRQKTTPPVYWTLFYYGAPYAHYKTVLPYSAVADAETQNTERHLILDFAAGKDVGLGMFGRNGTSTVGAGIRIASFTANSGANLTARPAVNTKFIHLSLFSGVIEGDDPYGAFDHYGMQAHAARSFKGIGPTLSWNASAALAGNSQDGELTLDWGIDAAILFGKQKAKTDHSTMAYHVNGINKYNPNTYTINYSHAHHSTRSRRVTVPNLGGSVGLSVKYPNFKFSIGYRYDTFLSAMDTGIDAAKKSNVTFNGPYASISIGLGD